MRTHGSARRSRAIWSPRRVSSFSRACSALRSASHCWRDTTGWFTGAWFTDEWFTVAISAMAVVMMSSLNAVRVLVVHQTWGRPADRWELQVWRDSPRRHLVEFRQGRIDMVPGVTAHAVRHHLRLVPAGIVEARGVHGEQVRHGREGQVDG